MSEPTIAHAETADVLEQALEVVPAEPDPSPPEIAWEADDADALEQLREVGVDDERDDDHQA